MTSLPAVTTAISENSGLRKWISRAFLLSILVYLVVLGYLLAEAVTGASKWAPYGVSIPLLIAMIIASEVVVTATAVWIFKDDAGIWPPEVSKGWRALRAGRILPGIKDIAIGAWDVSLIDLRLRSTSAILMGRLNRIAALVPLVYVIAASATSDVPWGLRGSAIFDIVLTLGVWAFMEAVMVRPEGRTAVTPATRTKDSRYEVRRLHRDDIPRVLELERIKWREQGASRQTIEARLANYSQGQLAVDHLTVEDGHVTRRSLVAWITVMAIGGDRVKTFGTWDQVSGDGTLSTCDPDGDTLVGVNLTSVTNGATYIIFGEMLASVVQWGKARFIGGGRLNGFVAFNEHRTAEGKRPFQAGEYANLREIRGYHVNEFRIEQGLPVLPDDQYLNLVNAQRARDGQPPLADDVAPDYVCSNMRGYLSIPGSYVVELIPGYFPDPASDDWGVVIAWDNPLPRSLRRLPFIRGFVANRIRREVAAEWDERKTRVREAARKRSIERTAASSRTTPEPERELASVG